MNNEKLILNALDWIICNTDAKDEIQMNIQGSLGQEIDKVLNPKQSEEEPCCEMPEEKMNVEDMGFYKKGKSITEKLNKKIQEDKELRLSDEQFQKEVEFAKQEKKE